MFTQLSTFTSASISVEVSVRGLLSAIRESPQCSNCLLDGDSKLGCLLGVKCADRESVLAADGEVTWDDCCCCCCCFCCCC
ncbi:hypothetical protein Mapa_010462 [Marchantia paleacea]|nr:hypothetical protein Mapa_010462 [Marchantia paleacea]